LPRLAMNSWTSRTVSNDWLRNFVRTLQSDDEKLELAQARVKQEEKLTEVGVDNYVGTALKIFMPSYDVMMSWGYARVKGASKNSTGARVANQIR
jgi:hypothetical protein